MRSKSEILEEVQTSMSNTPEWDTVASLHGRLTIEVLIDIRDILSVLSTNFGSNIFDLAREG